MGIVLLALVVTIIIIVVRALQKGTREYESRMNDIPPIHIDEDTGEGW